ncbi:MAG: hypothetical protein Q8T11_06155 [Elusimicrobiota bacterium]|nr:hypothetical protein [Elusimicrobiota bacterium]
MKTKKRPAATSRFTRGRKTVAKKTKRIGRRRTVKSRSEGMFNRALDRLTPA